MNTMDQRDLSPKSSLHAGAQVGQRQHVQMEMRVDQKEMECYLQKPNNDLQPLLAGWTEAEIPETVVFNLMEYIMHSSKYEVNFDIWLFHHYYLHIYIYIYDLSIKTLGWSSICIFCKARFVLRQP